jgi:branched-subunit amino acid aminotransferase/4-amino-4-deoxychorismate lyase
VITSSISRTDPRIKDTSFISKSNEQRKLLNKDVFEILLTRNGKVLEGMTSNFYVIARPAGAKQSPTRRTSLLRQEEHPPRNDMVLVTAQRGILLGVTRKAVLKLAKEQGMTIEYRAPLLNEKFNEAFLTSSSRGVVPIVSIDNKSVGQGRRRTEPVEVVGKWTKKLISAYREYIMNKSELIY